MKLIQSLLIASTFMGTAALAAPAIQQLPGIYVGYLDIQGPFYVTEIRISEDGSYKFRDARMDQPMPLPGCIGTYTYEDGTFQGELDCTAVGGGSGIIQTIDLSNVTREQLEGEEGVQVMVVSSAVGPTPLPFKMRKTDAPYFPEIED